MSSISDRELWACANEVMRQHGDGASRFVTERILALSLLGDTAGVDLWKTIALRIDQINRQSESLQ